MNEVLKTDTRAVGLVSIGNPITLIASFEKFKQICRNYKIYVMLNISRDHSNPDTVKRLTDNAYKIFSHYEKYFSEIVVIENPTKDWMTHGLCIDTIFAISTEDRMAIFEEDAYLFSDHQFKEWFDKLDENHLHCVVAPQNPNNFAQLFSKLGIFKDVVNMPGKESIFFIRRDILKHYDWPGFDYVQWKNDVVYKPNEKLQLSFKEDIHFDTFEFFSLNCWMNDQIKKSVYHEHNYDYWVSEGRNDLEAFYRHHTGRPSYIHYFNGSLFQYLDYHDEKNVAFYKDMVYNAPHFGQFLYHMSTYLIHSSIILAIRRRYIEILGVKEYQSQKKSLKNSLVLLFNYFGYWQIANKFKLKRYFKFTCRHSRMVHKLSDIV